ncbi:MAG: IS1595 family transposase [Bacteroidetes bacterium]|nr:IS1595 family transposase [Bacteroidales bacterium]NJO67903.1 IS1595 family transposase [Bacteroidota bacterium]
MKFDKLKLSVQKLNKSQKLELINYIKSSYSVFDDFSHVQGCPRCGSTHIVKNGTRNSITRYLCKDCRKSFTYKSTTILKGIHKINKWNEFVEEFISLKISSIEEITERLEISKQTALNWRHKLLAALMSKENNFSDETIEFDETFFLVSRKGRDKFQIEDYRAYKKWRRGQVGDSPYNVKVFFTYGRDGKHIELSMSHMGRTSMEHLKNYFIKSKFEDATVYSDSHPSYIGFFRRNGYQHRFFRSRHHINLHDRKVHVQTVNSYCKGFKEFINTHLHSVATKYIGLYAKWYEFIVNTKKKLETMSETRPVKFNIVDDLCKVVVNDINGLEYFRQCEVSFLNLLKANGRTNWGSCRYDYYARV